MSSGRLIKHWLSTLAVLCSMTSYAGINLDYASPMGEENWRMTGNRLRCGLSLTVPNYGIAYFEQYAAKQPHFLLDNWQAVGKRLPAIVVAKAPVWKPNGQSFFITKTTVNPGEYGLYLSRDPALKLLNFLAEGYQARFQYRSEQGFPVSVSLSPIRFQKVYAKYQRCIGHLLPFDYAAVRNSVLFFETDSSELGDEAKQQLQKVAEYYRADQQIKQIHIAGYTDDTGRKSYNNAVSEDRAKAVANYLQNFGVPLSRLSVTWYGVKDPAAPNDSAAGKQANRRVVVKILK